MRKPKMYHVTFRADAMTLPTILQTMEGCATLVAVREAPDLPGAPPAAPSAPRRVTRVHGMDGLKLLKQILAQRGGQDADSIASLFVEMGYAGASAKARISEAVRSGAVRRVGSKFYLSTHADLSNHAQVNSGSAQ